MIIRKPKGWSDVESIMARLSDQHRDEYSRLGFPSYEFNNRMAEFLANSEIDVLEFDGQPQALLAIRSDGPIPTTWLMVTTEFFEKAIATTRICKNYMKAAGEKFGPILSVSHASHPKMAKWLKTIGFEQINDKVFLFRA